MDKDTFIQSTNTTTFLAVFIPMTYLSIKCIFSLYIQKGKLLRKSKHVAIGKNVDHLDLKRNESSKLRSDHYKHQLYHRKHSKLVIVIVTIVVCCVAVCYHKCMDA